MIADESEKVIFELAVVVKLADKDDVAPILDINVGEDVNVEDTVPVDDGDDVAPTLLLPLHLRHQL